MAQLEKPKLPCLKLQGRLSKGIKYYYVQTYDHEYNPKTKTNKNCNAKSVGKIMGGDMFGQIEFYPEFIKQYPDLENFRTFRTKDGIEFKVIDDELDTVVAASKVVKQIGGTTWAINQAIAQTGIGDALREVFSKYHRDLKIASLVNYMLQQRTAVMHNYFPFAKTHWLPWSTPLNDGQIGSILKSVTADDITRFFNALNANYRRKFGDEFYKRLFVALDSTSISNYSNLSQADYGHNKDLDNLKQINYLMVCDIVSGMPIYGKTYKGNVVDVKTVSHLLIDLETVFRSDNTEAVKPNLVFVTDRGYDSSDNLQDFLRHGYSFVMRSKLGSSSWVRSIIDESYEELQDINNHDEFLQEFMFTKKVEYKYDAYPVGGKRKSNKDVQDVYVNMYYNDQIHFDMVKILRFNINSARELYNEKVQAYIDSVETIDPVELTKITIGNSLQEFIDKYCVFDDNGFAKVDKDKFNKKARYAGFMALISDCVSDPKEALFAYQNRQTVERNFQTLKSGINFNRPQASNDNVFQGRVLCEFIATAISILFNTRLRKYEKTDDALKDNFRINAYSQSRILDELNTIMLTCYKGGYYFDEIAGKYRYIYKALGIPVPEAQYKYTNDQGNEVDEEIPYETIDPELVPAGGEEL